MAQKHTAGSQSKQQEAGTSTGENTKSFEDMLLAIGQNQDKASFIGLFNHFAPRIKSFLMKGGMSAENADELAQETMLTIWDRAASYNPAQAAASTWIFTIARNKRTDALRKMSRENTSSLEDSTGLFIKDDKPGPASAAMRKQETDKIAQAMKSLPEDQLLLIKKSFYEDKSHAEIAQETGLPLGTVKSRIRLALEKMRGEQGVKDLCQ